MHTKIHKVATFSSPLCVSKSLILNQLQKSIWEPGKLRLGPSYSDYQAPYVVTYSRDTTYCKELKLTESLDLYSLRNSPRVYDNKGYARMQWTWTPKGKQLYLFDMSYLEEQKDISHCLLKIIDQLWTEKIQYPHSACFMITASYEDRTTLKLLTRLGYRVFLPNEAPELVNILELRAFPIIYDLFDYSLIPLAAAETYREKNKGKNPIYPLEIFKWLPFIKFL